MNPQHDITLDMIDPRKLIVLPLPYYMSEWAFDEDDHEEVPSVFQRDGLYALRTSKGRGIAWYEYDGRAYKADYKQAKYSVSVYEPYLRECEVESLKTLCNSSEPLIKKEARRLLYEHEIMVMIRETSRESKLWSMRFHKEWDQKDQS